MTVSLPATTSAFEAANIFARTNGYIEKRYVDIGDHVKAGALLAEITAPELDHQIAQAQATLAQTQATLQQTRGKPGARRRHQWARQQPGQAGLAHASAGRQRSPDLAGTASRSGRRPVQYHRAGSPDPGPRAGEGLPARRRAVRRRHHPAQHRRRQPGAVRIDLHVHADAPPTSSAPRCSCRRTRPSGLGPASRRSSAFRKFRTAAFPARSRASRARCSPAAGRC